MTLRRRQSLLESTVWRTQVGSLTLPRVERPVCGVPSLLVLKISKAVSNSRLGEGTELSFGLTLGVRCSTLASQFLSLHHLSLRLLGYISEFYSTSSGQLMWDIPLRRNLNSEAVDYTNLLSTISSCRIRDSDEDSLVWWPDPLAFSQSSPLSIGILPAIVLLLLTLRSGPAKLLLERSISFGLLVWGKS